MSQTIYKIETFLWPTRNFISQRKLFQRILFLCLMLRIQKFRQNFVLKQFLSGNVSTEILNYLNIFRTFFLSLLIGFSKKKKKMTFSQHLWKAKKSFAIYDCQKSKEIYFQKKKVFCPSIDYVRSMSPPERLSIFLSFFLYQLRTH